MGPAKLSGFRKDAQRAFRSGVSDKYVASVYNDIRTAADSADTLAGVCGLTLGADDEGVKTLSSIAADIRETDDEETMLRRFKALKSETERVYTAFTDKETDANPHRSGEALLLQHHQRLHDRGQRFVFRAGGRL